MTNQETPYGKNATHPWYDIGWCDVDQFRITRNGRILIFEFKHEDHAPVAPESYGPILKVAERLNAPVFLIEYSCEDRKEPWARCTGDMSRHGLSNRVIPLNKQAGIFLPPTSPKTFTKEMLKEFVERIQ